MADPHLTWRNHVWPSDIGGRDSVVTDFGLHHQRLIGECDYPRASGGGTEATSPSTAHLSTQLSEAKKKKQAENALMNNEFVEVKQAFVKAARQERRQKKTLTMSAPPKSLHVGKRLSRNRAVRRATVDQRDVQGNLATMDNIMQHHASTTSKLGKKIEEVKPHYLGKTLSSTRPGTDLRSRDKVESSPRSSTGWFETPFSAASHEAAARMVDYHHQENRKAVGPRRPASASSFRRGTATPEKSKARRVAYTVGADESWESVYRRQYRQLLLKKFLAFETDHQGKQSKDDDILKVWKEKLLQEPYGSSDPKVQILREEVVQEFLESLP